MSLYSSLMKMAGLDSPQTTKDPAKAKLDRGDRDLHEVSKAHSLNDFMDIHAILSFECYGDRPIGAFLIKREDKLKVRFGLDVTGYHSFSLEHELKGLWNGIIAATRSFPEGEPLGIRLSSFKSADDRMHQLLARFQGTDNRAIQSLIMAEIKNVETLAHQGLREPKSLQVFPGFVGFRDETSEHKADVMVESTTGLLENLYRFYKGDAKHQKSRADLKTFLLDSYSRGFQTWVDLLTQSIGVDVSPLTPMEMWAYLWSRINPTPPPPIPYLVRFVHDTGQSKIIRENKPSHHLTYYLAETCTPKFDHQYVRFDTHNASSQEIERRYTGGLVFDDKIESWGNGYEQTRFLWDLLTHDGVTDTEIFIELSAMNKSKAAKTASRLYQQALLDVRNAAEKSRYIARAETQIQESRDQMLALSMGDCPCSVGAFILVHRKTTQELERACLDIKTKLAPHSVTRERDIAYRLWTQSFFCDYNPLLHIPGIGNLRIPYQSNEVPGFVPMISTLKGDSSGVEFIARDGGTPYYLQLFEQGREVHFGLIAGHRSGKSTTSIDIIIEALSMGIPVTVMDYPAKDGRSSFYDFTHYVGGAYLDIGKESINILEIPDFTSLPPELQRERFTDFQIFVNKQIMALLNPDPNDYQLKQAVDDIISAALREFFSDGVIQSRYEDAMAGGFGSEAWQDTPTLHDFKKMCVPERLTLSKSQADNDGIRKAFAFIQRRLTAKLDSNLGRAIARPSTIRTDSQLTVFALRSLDDEDSAVFSLAAFSLAARRSLEHPMSMVLFDESQQLATYESICDLAKTFVSTGGKQGIRAGFITNDFEALAQSAAGATILANLNVKIIGRLSSTDAKKVGETFELTPEIMDYTHSAKFKRDKKRLSSSWIITEDGKVTFTRRYCPRQRLSLAASNMWEADVRAAYFKEYGPQKGLSAFSKVHIHALQNEEELTLPNFAQVKEIAHAS